MVPGDVLSKTDISPGAKLMYGRVRIFTGKINTEYVANDLGLKLDEAVQYLHELVNLKLVEENRLDEHTYFLFSSRRNNMNSSFFNRSNNRAKEEEKKEESLISLKKEEEKKEEKSYFSKAPIRELREKLYARRLERESDENRRLMLMAEKRKADLVISRNIEAALRRKNRNRKSELDHIGGILSREL